MIIKKIRVQNFRSIKDATLECDPITILIGPNGGGKSAFLHALSIFYNPNADYSEEDFYNRETENPITITVTFGDLTEEEKRLFASYLEQGDLLTVIKECHYPRDKGSQKYYGMRWRHPEFESIRQITKPGEKKKAYSKLRSRSEYSDLPEVSRADEIENALKKWEDEHPDKCEWQRDDGQFFGFKEVGSARLERFTQFVLIPAVRDASIDAVEAKGSVLTTIMGIFVKSILERDEQIQQLKAKTKDEYNQIISKTIWPQLTDIEKHLTRFFQTYSPNAEIRLNWQPFDDISLPYPKAEALLEEDGFRNPVSRTGHGMQRLFIMSILQTLALVQQKQSSSEQHPEAPGLPGLILCIEEPELYQHPSQGRVLARVLYDLTKSGIEGVFSKIQVIYTTHSPLFVDIQHYQHIRLIRKELQEEGKPRQTQVRSVSLNNVAQKIKEAWENTQGTFREETLIPRVVTVMNPWLNEGFFANVVVLVEGQSDRAALLTVAEKNGCDLEKLGIAVIPCEGKRNLDRPYAIFSGLGIPVYVIWDSDERARDEKVAKVNRALLRLLGATEPHEDWPERIEKHFACFRENLNTKLRSDLGQNLFDQLLRECYKKYQLDPKQAEKNPVVIAEIISKAYEGGHRVSTLEQILDRILELRGIRATLHLCEGGYNDSSTR
jgi:predicted ATP-dependent endonuclease of OLD family